MKVPSPLIPIDQERLARVLRSEFEFWVHNFGKRPVTQAQDLRAFFVQWFAAFAPECFEHPFVKEISTFANETRQQENFNARLWYEVLPIENALYALTLDSFWISTARANLNHHNSALRMFVLESLLLVVDKLRFDDPHLLACVTDNLKTWHVGSDETVLFLTMAQGSPEAKKSQIKQWLDEVKMSPDDRDKLQAFSNGEFISNPFLHYFTKFACYVLLRLASEETRHQQLSLFPEFPDKKITTAVDERQLNLPNVPVDIEPDPGTLIWQRMNGHPVFQSYIHIRDD